MAEEQVPQEEEASTHTISQSFWRRFARSKMGMLGLLMLGTTVLMAVFAPWIAPYDPYEPVQATAADVMAPPSPERYSRKSCFVPEFCVTVIEFGA